jgi:hypothetical protein
MIIATGSSSNFTPCPAGTFLARCCRVIDLGTQTVEYQGEAKPAHKVLITFEVIDPETFTDAGGCYTASKRYTASLHEKAALRRDLETWRGAKFTDAELQRFDLAGILGKQALLSIVHAEKDGRTFANIAGLVKPPKGLSGSEPSEPLVHFDLANPNWPLFDTLGEKLRAQIASSPEYAAARKKPAVPFADMDDDLADVAF